MTDSAGLAAVLLLTTTSTRDEAERIGESLVAKRLVACGSVIPMVHSFFHWEGRLQREHEALLLLKTTAAAAPAAQAELLVMHSSVNPEVLEVPVSGGAAAYLAWLAGEVRPRAD